LQIFTQYKDSIRGASISKVWPEGHNEAVKKDNGVREYCMKEDTRLEGPWEYGTYNSYAGNKNAEIAKNIREKDIINLINSGELKYVHYQAAMRYKMAAMEQEIRKEVKDVTLPKKRHYWIYGPANTGKTTWRENNLKEDTYEIPFNGDWKGYAGEHNLWIDEYRGCLAPNELNKLCDGG
jgi:hypothetical protein